MNYIKYIKSLSLLIVTAMILTTGTICSDRVMAQTQSVKPAQKQVQSVKPVQKQTQAAAPDTVNAITVAPLTIVNSPKEYLNKTVVMQAKFDKFSTLGLDYKPAFKSSDDYISFLIKRDDTTFNIPLSEMKLFLPRKEAEKFIDLKTNDEIKIQGVVFSDALGDAWVDVKSLNLIKKAPEEVKK